MTGLGTSHVIRHFKWTVGDLSVVKVVAVQGLNPNFGSRWLAFFHKPNGESPEQLMTWNITYQTDVENVQLANCALVMAWLCNCKLGRGTQEGRWTSPARRVDH